MRYFTNVTLSLITATSFSYCIFLVDEKNTIGFFPNYIRIFFDFFLLGPALFVIAYYSSQKIFKSAKAITLFDKLKSALFLLNSGLLAYLIIATLFNENGLWIEGRTFDNYFSHTSTSNHYFNPIVGLTGIYIAAFSFFIQRSHGNRIIQVHWKEYTSFLPLIIFYIILWTNQFIEQPHFMG